MTEFKKGEKVLAHVDGGDRIGFVLDPDANADGKHTIQVGADTYGLAYREPENYDERGSGGTFQKL